MFGVTRKTHLVAPIAALALVFLGFAPSYATEESTSSDQASAEPSPSGDTASPQPTSRADSNDGGANGQCPGGPYCSTRDGSASQNGSGDGQAKGEPCAGCVGKADNKNPKGQMPNGSDDNSGYECDSNNGVGKSNPAHTGCTASPSPSAEETAPAAAARSGGSGQPEVLGVQASRGTGPGANRAAPGLDPVSAVLPDTGSSAKLMIFLADGIVLLLLGTAVMAFRRRGARR